nr:AfsR/SARP family transcriptional regulator [Streptomyces mangrovisoli]
MDIGVLGSLAVRVNGVSVAPSAPKPRQVLALLAVNADRIVGVDVLVEELWGRTPPRSARPTLQTYILQIRELITAALGADTPADTDAPADAESSKDVLATVPGGYVLRVGGGGVDVWEFERLAGRGYRAVDGEDFAAAAGLLGEALGLFSGVPLGDVTTGTHLRTQVRRLEEARLCALDQRIDAELRLGRHRELLAELTVLVSRYPAHESLCGQLMVALYRSGRRGEALEAYQRLRTVLVRSLGLEPSAALAKLQRSILRAGPESGVLGAGRAVRPAAPTGPTGPAVAATAAVPPAPPVPGVRLTGPVAPAARPVTPIGRAGRAGA